jgi:GxxExxY protein
MAKGNFGHFSSSLIREEKRNTKQTKNHETDEKGPKMNETLIFPDESYKITGACMEVYKTLGNGFLEAVYQEAVEIEFRKREIPFCAQLPLNILYKGLPLKHTYKPDFVCYEKIIVELKSVSDLADEHFAQVMNYLKGTGYKLGILYNFGHYPLLEIVRVPNIKVKI